MDRIFIIDYGYSHDWIMGKIADDILNNAEALGYQCRCGSFQDYRDEEICYHLAWHLAVPIPRAKHNSVFYTHLNDVFKEISMVDIKDKFDSFICMSPEDAVYLKELGFDSRKVYGKTLPVRNNFVRPISIGIFSACYEDGRKNEEWLLDYCRSCEGSKYANFVFVGRGWGNVCNELEKLGCTYEWHNVSRKLPYEYIFQQNKLACLNYYIYMGMDGGAMGTYDAYAQDVPLCVTFDGFHKSIPELDYTFDDKQGFFNQMDLIIAKQVNRIMFFKENNPGNYVKWLMDVWQNKGENTITDKDKTCISYNTVVDKKRDQYYGATFAKFKQFLAWKLAKRNYKKKFGL